MKVKKPTSHKTRGWGTHTVNQIVNQTVKLTVNSTVKFILNFFGCRTLHRVREGCRFSTLTVAVTAGKFADNGAHEILGIAEEHQGFIQVVERVIDSRESRSHTSLDDHHGACLVDVENRHSEYRAARIGARGWLGYVTVADDQRYIGLR